MASQPTRPSAWPIAAALIIVLMWAAAFPAIAIALRGFSPAPLAAVRFLAASLALLVIARLFRIGLPDREDLPRLAAVGLVGITAYNLLLNLGQTTVSAGVTVLLININPIFAAILARFLLGERLKAMGWAGVLVAFAGAALIALSRSGWSLEIEPGALYIVAAAICFALQWVLQKPLLARYRPLAVAIWVIWCGTALLLPFLPIGLRQLSAAPLDAVAATVFLALGPAALAYVVWAYTLAHFPVGRATSFLYLVPPVSLLIAWLLLGEIPGLWTLVGGALTLSGVIIVNTLGRTSPPAKDGR
jgi:drug/metabolite transporter (DMT)-like permease